MSPPSPRRRLAPARAPPWLSLDYRPAHWPTYRFRDDFGSDHDDCDADPLEWVRVSRPHDRDPSLPARLWPVSETEERDWIYVVTDIEVDGPHPGPNSMRSFASIAVSADGQEHGRFEAVLEPLPGAAPNSDTYAWFQTVPEAWTACTADPRPVATALRDYVAWLHALPQPRAFVASPLGFDGTWIDYYLRRFTQYGLARGPYETDRVFHGAGFCLASYAAAVLGTPLGEFNPRQVPDVLFGDVPHTHRAIDDALGYANLLVNLMAGRTE